MFAHLQHCWHEPEVLISHYLRQFVGPCKRYFIASVRYKSDGLRTNSVRQLATHQTDHDEDKPEVV